jgi:hypothetical protein
VSGFATCPATERVRSAWSNEWSPACRCAAPADAVHAARIIDPTSPSSATFAILEVPPISVPAFPLALDGSIGSS